MESILEKINYPEDLKKLSKTEKQTLVQEIRELLIQTISKTGGHLASNLGVVELTIALHSVFKTPEDQLIWDVGHQTYVHKILTGRKNKFSSLRQLNGLAGFPKVSESNYDSFNTGHSSTSISVALGMARAQKLQHTKNKIVAIIGDGALTGGMALEALNDAGASKTDLIVILNDNEMSISKNVGAISCFLSKMRTKKIYRKSNKWIKGAAKHVPGIGRVFIAGVRKIKYGIKQFILPNMLFEDLGFKYLGPIDGHNIEKLEDILTIAKDLKGPVLIHVLTKKGKGYKPAEENPSAFHGISSFCIDTGKTIGEKKKDYSKVFGETLVKLAKKDERIVAITAAMTGGTGLSLFKQEFPNRIFDVGIAEQHALGMVAGMAKAGLKPVISLYSSFYQRGYDQVIHDICIQELPVVMCVDRAGIVGNDGETHQGLYDLAFFSTIPNITILAPKDFLELSQMLAFAFDMNKPVVIRYPRGGEGDITFDKHEQVEYGKAEIIEQGNDLTILAIGKMVERAKNVADILESDGQSVEIINVRSLKPLDENKIIESIEKTRNVITIEDGTIEGGLGSKVAELITKKQLQNIYFKAFAYPDEFIKHGSVSQIEEKYGLDAKTIAAECKKTCNI